MRCQWQREAKYAKIKLSTTGAYSKAAVLKYFYPGIIPYFCIRYFEALSMGLV